MLTATKWILAEIWTIVLIAANHDLAKNILGSIRCLVKQMNTLAWLNYEPHYCKVNKLYIENLLYKLVLDLGFKLACMCNFMQARWIIMQAAAWYPVAFTNVNYMFVVFYLFHIVLFIIIFIYTG